MNSPIFSKKASADAVDSCTNALEVTKENIFNEFLNNCKFS